MDAFGAAQAIETGGGENQRVGLAFGPFTEAGVDVATHFYELEIGTQGEQHGFAAGAGGADAGAHGQHVEAPVIFADKGVSGVGAWGGWRLR